MGLPVRQLEQQSTCETPKLTKKFKWPLTLYVYEVGEKNTVGEKLGSVTKTFAMPYRPSDDLIHCPSGEQWYERPAKNASTAWPSR